MQNITLSTLDLAIVAVYFLLVFAIAIRMARRTHSADDLFLAGRRLGWLPIGLSLFASNISSTTRSGWRVRPIPGVSLWPTTSGWPHRYW